MSTIHTPGPWKAAKESQTFGSDPESITIFSLSDAEYAPARVYGDNREEMWANARLIAKAPEMYDLLKELFGDYLAEVRRTQTMARKQYGFKTIEIEELPLVKGTRALLREIEGQEMKYKGWIESDWIEKTA